MNNLKKIGLTALAGSLVVTSAVAGEMSVAGGASTGLKNTSHTTSGKSWTMGNQLTFTGSGELDNGMNVSLSFILDQDDDTTQTEAKREENSPFDSHSVTISSDTLGTLVFSGEGGSSAQSAIDTTAAGDLWDNGSGFDSPSASEAGNNSMMYTLPSIVDGVAINASYSPGGTGGPSATAWSIAYTGIEGLSANYAIGETETVGSAATHTTMKASYAYGSFTGAYSETDSETDASGGDETVTAYALTYTVTDEISVTYGAEAIETEGQATDEEADKLSVSYTTGGVTLSATQYNFENVGNAASATKTGRWALGATFAF